MERGLEVFSGMGDADAEKICILTSWDTPWGPRGPQGFPNKGFGIPGYRECLEGPILGLPYGPLGRSISSYLPMDPARGRAGLRASTVYTSLRD